MLVIPTYARKAPSAFAASVAEVNALSTQGVALEQPPAPVIDYTDPANAQQNNVPVEERQYQIVDRLGPFGDDSVAYEDETTVRQIAYAAQRYYNEPNAYNEQNADFGIIRATSTDQFVRTSADYNQKFIAYMLQGPGRGIYGSDVDTSWGYYMSWILGINDGASFWHADWGGGWSGFESNFYGYAGWYVNVKKLSVYAVPHNVLP